jgi:hypothetical protein
VAADDLFIISTLREAGVVNHIVGFDQTLIRIANQYDVELKPLKRNGLKMDSLTYSKEKIIVRPSHTPGSFNRSNVLFADIQVRLVETAVINGAAVGQDFIGV